MERKTFNGLMNSIDVGAIYLADVSTETRISRLAFVEVVAKYKYYVRVRTIIVPGEYGMSKPYDICLFPNELTRRFETVKAIRKYIVTEEPYSSRYRACFNEKNGNREKNKAIWDTELKRIACLLGDIYE